MPVKKRRRSDRTPRSQIRNVLRQLWMRSRERAAALKRDGYSCRYCGVKQSKAKGKEQAIEVHHNNGSPDWERMIDAIIEELLVHPLFLCSTCPTCHDKRHEAEKYP